MYFSFNVHRPPPPKKVYIYITIYFTIYFINTVIIHSFIHVKICNFTVQYHSIDLLVTKMVVAGQGFPGAGVRHGVEPPVVACVRLQHANSVRVIDALVVLVAVPGVGGQVAVAGAADFVAPMRG